MRRFPIALLTAVAAGAVAAAPAGAAWSVIGSDLSKPATIAHSDPNDVVFWPGATPGGAGIDVPTDGQAIQMHVRGGTPMDADQYRRAKAMDPNFDLFQFLVLSPRGDGWHATWASQSLTMPRIGDGATPDTVTTFKAGGNNPMCVKRGDRIAVASVGGYTPGIFDNGLPYQIFGASPGAGSFGYRHATDPRREEQGGKIQLDNERNTAHPPTSIRTTDSFAGQELLLRVTVGTGRDARFTCGGSAPTQTNGQFTDPGDAAYLPAFDDPRTSSGPDPVPSGGSSGGGSSAPKLKAAMAIPRAATVRLGRDGRVPVSVRCRPDGGACSGRVELRVHKRSIGSARYSLTTGQRGTVQVRLTRQGRRFVRVDSDRRMVTTVRVTATGGRQKVGRITILPASRERGR